jgi:hypothetical protein
MHAACSLAAARAPLQRTTVTISIDYRLVGTGWSRCSIALDGDQVEITGSYLSDCLGALADAAVLLQGGATSTRCSFDEEPGEYRWIIECTGSQARVRILEFAELWGDRPDAEGQVLLDGHCDATAFVTAVRDALERVANVHGVDGYKQRWVEHDFPAAQLRTLQNGARRTGA